MDTVQQVAQGESDVGAVALEWGMTKLATVFPGSFPDKTVALEKALLWRELLDAHPWISLDVFRAGIKRIAWEHKGDFLPTPAAALEFFQATADQLRRETQKALPPPAAPPSTGEEAMERYRAMVAASAARGKALHARQRQIVGEALSMGLKHGTEAMSAYVRTAYGRAVRGED